MSCAKARIIKATDEAGALLFAMDADTNVGRGKPPPPTLPLHRASDSTEHFLGLAALLFAAFGQHFGQDVTCAIGIAHVDVGLG